MRITNANAFKASINTLQERQQDLSQSNLRLTSGKRVSLGSDDPTAAARAERALATEARTDASQRGLNYSRTVMQQAEGALGDASELLQQARELVVAAGNAGYTDAERKNLAKSLLSLRDQLLNVANRGDGAGGFVFAGQAASQQPFVDTPDGVQFRGVTGQMQGAGDEALPLTADGSQAWLRARTGNGVFEVGAAAANAGSAWADSGRVDDPAAYSGEPYSIVFSKTSGGTTYSVLRDGNATAQANVPYVSGRAISFEGISVTLTGNPADGDVFDLTPSTQDLSAFDVLDGLVNDLQTEGRSNTQITQGVINGLRDIDAVMGSLQSIRAQAGETLHRTDALESRLADSKLAAQTDRSNAEDLDMVQAISEFQNKQSGYDAALKTYAMVQRLSLFQYLNG